jgi:hypothetical protein
MARVKTRSRKQKYGLIPALIILGAVAVVVITTISPSADVRRAAKTNSQSGAPTLTSVYPSSAKVGDVISIRGQGLQPGSTSVYMGSGVVTNYLANSTSSTINVYVPDTVCLPPVKSSCKGVAIKPGTYKIYVTDLQGRKSNELTFTVKK